MKTQVIIERNSQKIIDVQQGKGSEHDFKVYKDTIGTGVSKSIPLDADSGYQGIKEYHANSFIPIKSSKKHQLTKKEKTYNKRLSQRRVIIEHINAKIKVFKSLMGFIPRPLGGKTEGVGDLFPRIRKDYEVKSLIHRPSGRGFFIYELLKDGYKSFFF